MNEQDLFPQTPYPTKGELIRFAYRVLGLRKLDKELDRYAANGDYDYTLEARYLNGLQTQLTDIFDAQCAYTLLPLIKGLLSSYSELVTTVAFDGVPRDKSLGLLVENFFGPWAAMVAKNLGARFRNPMVFAIFLSRDISPVDVVVKTMRQQSEDFVNAWHSLNKGDKDKLSRWSKKSTEVNSDLPDAKGIADLVQKLVNSWPGLSSKSEQESLFFYLSVMFLIAIVVERCKREVSGKSDTDFIVVLSRFLASDSAYDCGRAISLAVIEQNKGLDEYAKHNMLLHYQLYEPGVTAEYEEVKGKIKETRIMAATCDSLNESIYYIDWLEGRLHTLAGDFSLAIKFYKQAFKGACYRAGNNQTVIMREAIALAAYCGNQRSFLKNLKNQMVAFGLMSPSAYRSDPSLVNKQSRSKHDVVEDWEIRNWVQEFDLLFPIEKRFHSFVAKKTKYKAFSGPLVVSNTDEMPLVDTYEPDKLITVYGKCWHQLTYFAYENDLESVQKLLEAGASVDVATDAGDTPILMSLQEMDPFVVGNSMSKKCFDLLSQYPHKLETLATISVKKRLAPMICAVETGRSEIVDRMIELGADVNHRADVLGLTPLIVCINLLDKVRNPEKFRQRLRNAPVTLDTFEAARRHSNGAIGMDFETFNKAMNSPLLQLCNDIVQEKQINRLVAHVRLDSVKRILHRLLSCGARTNIRYTVGELKGYTPLMLAAELDDIETLQLLLEHGADPEQVDGTGRNALTVARQWKAANAVKLLQELC